MRLLPLALMLCFAVACGPSVVKVDGEFRVTDDRGAPVSLAGADVSVYRFEDVGKMADSPSMDVYGYLKQLPAKTFETVTADSEGRFSFRLPKGEYAVFAVANRDVGGRKEFYQWLVPAKPKTTLSNSNLAGRGESLLPRRFSSP